jgi:hypothetical protein
MAVDAPAKQDGRSFVARNMPRRPRTAIAPLVCRLGGHCSSQVYRRSTALFTHRYLFVQRHVSKTERKLLWRITRGLPQVYVLRVLMDQVCALFDRCCRTKTALDKLDPLRRRLPLSRHG